MTSCKKCSGRIWISAVLLLTGLGASAGLELTARFSQNGLHGEVRFTADTSSNSSGAGAAAGTGLLVNTFLEVVGESEATAENPDVWSWSVHEYPTDYSLLDGRCDEERLGRVMVDLDGVFNRLSLPELATSEFVLPDDSQLALTGPRGVWGRSLLLVNAVDGRRACATITVSGRADERVAEARFQSVSVAGSVFFRWVGSHSRGDARSDPDGLTAHMDTLIFVDLYRAPPVNATKSHSLVITEHEWKIYVTDILDSESDKARQNCNFLQLVFNPDASKATLGDLSARLGPVRVAQEPATARSVFRDPVLDLVPTDLGGHGRSLHLVLLDPQHPDSFLACAQIRLIQPVTSVANLLSAGVKGRLILSQRSQFDPTLVRYDVNFPGPGAPLVLRGLRVQELPPPPSLAATENRCNHTGAMYDPVEKGRADPLVGFLGQDRYAVGDLSSKVIPLLPELQSVTNQLQLQLWDMFLPLQGPFSVVHRTFVLYKEDERNLSVSSPWVCASFSRYVSENGYKMPILTTEAAFRYPLAGRIIFRQPRDDPYSDTTIIVEPLVHSGGPSNNTQEHRWMVHDLPPGKDYFNWTARCMSAGRVFDPYHILPVNSSTTAATVCRADRPGLCRLGDLTTRHGTLNIAGRRVHAEAFTRRLFTDRHLRLSGAGSVQGRSLVLFDDNGPKARGERLACSKITAVYRRKAVVKNWFSNGKGEGVTVTGKLELFQQSEYEGTDIEIDLEGLDNAHDFEVHEASVQEQLEFPCEDTTLDGVFAPPTAVTPAPPTTGTPDQHPVGDLGAKFGFLDNQTHLDIAYNDTTLPLFGPNAIIGRSVVLSKKARNHRWACSSIERGYAPSEARELRAIASFHHPAGFAYGYIKMTQLIYFDGSQSETAIEVNLRHPGKHDRNVTLNHNWAIYVNPVGVDAAVKVLNTRCTAAGYIWNPHFTQLADPRNDELYQQECGPDNPLRCYTGDISGRLGPINLGLSRKVFTDSSFPLEGKVSAMGRSIVILNKDFGSERFACANIEPDNDIIKYANIRKPPRFVVSQFIEDVRDVMGVPEWMLTVDSRKTKALYNGNCIQFLLHFKGPIAHQLEQDFSRLLNTGKLHSPTLSVPGFVANAKRKSSLPYKLCGSTDPAEKKQASGGILISLLSRNKNSSASCVSCSAAIVIFITILNVVIL